MLIDREKEALFSKVLRSKNWQIKQGCRKLRPKYIGPFEIEKMVGANAAKLRLPPEYRIHRVINVS